MALFWDFVFVDAKRKMEKYALCRYLFIKNVHELVTGEIYSLSFNSTESFSHGLSRKNAPSLLDACNNVGACRDFPGEIGRLVDSSSATSSFGLSEHGRTSNDLRGYFSNTLIGVTKLQLCYPASGELIW